MSKYTKSEEMIVCDEDKITFENKSDSNYLVSTGIAFKKSGLYNVLVEPKRTVISKIADSQTDWIPVSERLPNIGDTFLVTVMVGTRIKTDVASNFGSYIDGFWDTFNDWIEDEECHVTAWMPLPEPYKGGDTE